MKQRDYFEDSKIRQTKSSAHGGTLRAGRRKVARPLDRKKPLHLVLKSSLAKGKYSLLNAKHRLRVEDIIRERAKRDGLKIHGFENMGNHIHAVVSFQNRDGFRKFLRVISGLIARLVTGAQRGKAFGKRFWDQLAFTRVVNGQSDFKSLMNYLKKNDIEREDPVMRKAIEFHESLERKARRRGCDVDVIYDEWMKANGLR